MIQQHCVMCMIHSILCMIQQYCVWYSSTVYDTAVLYHAQIWLLYINLFLCTVQLCIYRCPLVMCKYSFPPIGSKEGLTKFKYHFLSMQIIEQISPRVDNCDCLYYVKSLHIMHIFLLLEELVFDLFLQLKSNLAIFH